MDTSIKCVWSVICQRAHIDSRTNLISLIDIVERWDIVLDKVDGKKDIFSNDESIILKQPMIFPIQFTVVNYWEIPKELEGKDIYVEIDIISPNKKSLGKADFQFKTEHNTGFHRTLTDFNALPIKESGIYTFNIKVKNEHGYKSLSRIPLQINIKVKNNKEMSD